MSDSNIARRSAVQVFFAGRDISESLQDYLVSLTYTDNEEDAADDLQIKLADRDGIWLTKWLNQALHAAASSPSDTADEADGGRIYKVTAKAGVAARNRPSTDYYIYGTLAYGTAIQAISEEGGWVKFDYGGKTAYADAAFLAPADGSGTDFAVGDEVIVSGRPRATCYGILSTRAAVSNYRGKITRVETAPGAGYPIHVGVLGWFAADQVRRLKDTAAMSRTGSPDAVTKGLSIQAVILRENWNSDGRDRYLNCGQFELDSLECAGPPNVITLKATSLPYRHTIRGVPKTRSWEAYDLRGIAQEMADGAGMTCMYLSSRNPRYRRVEQVATGDIALLQKLCHRAGASLKVTANMIVIFDQEEYENREAVRVIRRGAEGGYTKYRLSSGEADTKYDSCRVSYTDPATGNVIEGIAYAQGRDETDGEDRRQYEVTEKVESPAEALELAAKYLRLKNKFEYTASFTFPGDPALLAGLTVELTDFGGFDGKYVIKTAKHTVSRSGYTTQVTLRRALEGGESKSNGI